MVFSKIEYVLLQIEGLIERCGLMEGSSQQSSLFVGVWQDSACPQSNPVTLAMLNTQQGKLRPPLEQPCPAQPVLGDIALGARDSFCPWGSP